MKGKKRNIGAILGYSALALCAVGIGVYLFKNENISEKVSYASSRLLNKSATPPSAERRPAYKYQFEEFEHPNDYLANQVSAGGYDIVLLTTMGRLYENDYIFAGTADVRDTVIWNQDGEIKHIFGLVDPINGLSKVFGINKLLQVGILEEAPAGVYSYLSQIDKPRIPLEPSNGYTLKSSTKELSEKESYFKKIFKDKGLSNFPSVWDIATEGKWLNNKGDVAGTQYYKTEQVSGGVVWLASNDYEPINLADTIAEQLGIEGDPGQQIYQIEDNRNIWANARGKKKEVKLGYFEYVEPNQWKLKQTWYHQDPNSTYTMLGGSNENYAVIQEYDVDHDDLFKIKESSFVYQKRKLPRLFSREPFIYRYKVEDYLKDRVNGELEVFTIFNMNSRNEILALYATNRVVDTFIMNLDTKEITLFSDLIRDRKVNIPSDYEFFPSLIGDDGSIYGSYRIGDSFDYSPGVLRAL
ncbi:MAG TPA: hypothetical protein VJY47_01035 [Candidatus Dojkabacteria bacterium]|nr:hypothetical protein [Candidatus Dojkabacteria bacterium]